MSEQWGLINYMKYIFLIFTIFLSPSLALFACHRSIEEMSVEEKVGQLLLVHFNGQQVNEDALRLIREAHVGGFIYYTWANGLKNPSQIQKLSSGLQCAALSQTQAIPLFIAIDQEGGVVNRLSKEFTSFPGNAALGRTGDPQLAEESAFAMGTELAAVGINMNLAPVVDVNMNPKNPVIGIRSFGDNVDEVIAFGKAALCGYRRASLMTCLKHFPGHGDVVADSHGSLPVVDKTIDELRQVELKPFKYLADQSEAIMTAHIMLPQLDHRWCATLSSKILQSLLKEEWRYQGLIISDSLVMQGLLDNTLEDGQTPLQRIIHATKQAYLAGCDLLLLGGKQLLGKQDGFELAVEDILAIHRQLVAAVKKGEIPQERIDSSINKILSLKKSHPAFKRSFPENAIATNIKSSNHLAIARQIAQRSVQIASANVVLPLDQNFDKMLIVSPAIVAENLSQTPFWQAGKILLHQDLNPNPLDISKAKQLAGSSDTAIIFTYNAWLNSEQIKLVRELKSKANVVAVIALRDARDAELLKDMDIVMTTFSPSAPSIERAYELLFLGKPMSKLDTARNDVRGPDKMLLQSK